MALCIACKEYFASVENKCSQCSKSIWTITIKTMEKSITINVNKTNTVRGLKCLACNRGIGRHPDMFAVIFAGNQLEDDKTLEESGLRDGVTLHFVGILRGD